jgi:hypothetical protein
LLFRLLPARMPQATVFLNYRGAGVGEPVRNAPRYV